LHRAAFSFHEAAVAVGRERADLLEVAERPADEDAVGLRGGV
jgi:hypothetical protein